MDILASQAYKLVCQIKGQNYREIEIQFGNYPRKAENILVGS